MVGFFCVLLVISGLFVFCGVGVLFVIGYVEGDYVLMVLFDVVCVEMILVWCGDWVKVGVGFVVMEM